ncbi:DUF885 domain-containing protein [Galbibacter sp. EGI 63066]|uniref:DUF885 domain-containing protein n=1 Tax=Galbibacter sp. EGI 63066 TaxID=2993559 RepID=UPI0022499AAB|nr:DUF885 domain-containing protein [Galbibacter sp. EGI 63066]MCX2678804.1 DUF885 domain-containing protein [Galbibacter sp. EGI 63066]
MNKNNLLSSFVFPLYIILFLFISCSEKNLSSSQLEDVIQTVEDFELYDGDKHPLGRFEKELYKKDADFAEEQLNKLDKIDPLNLSETEKISLELLKFKLQNRIDEYTYEMYLNPIQADQGFHLNLNYRIKPFFDHEDAKKYLNMLNDIPHFVSQNLVLIREGIDKGISQPKIIFNGYESTYNDHIVDDPTESHFYSPLKKLPESLTETQKDSILKAAIKAIKDSVVPAFKKIKTFFEEEYIPNTREAIGVSETPGGREFYQNRINFYTTTKDYTAEDIHQLGLKEVKRIKSQMETIIEEIDYEGSFEDFLKFLRTDKQFYATTGEELLKEARNIAKKIDNELPKYFITLPRKPYGVIKVPDAIAPKYTAGRYSGSRNSRQAGHYLVNTYKLDSRPLYALPALTAHEAVPGHHLQGSLNSELGDSIPKFRQQLYLSAYGEGWGLYSEFLADEMGIYTTPYEEFGKLTYEMWRACRLVVDTGIHAKGWTRKQAVDFMKQNTALSEHEINTETDRYIAWPGQAISYKIGELKIRELRKKAKAALGTEFDIREFHEVILGQGTVTLPILERRVNQYIEKKENSSE